MALISRGTKSTGGTAFQDGANIIAAEHNTDFDTIVNDYNGNISNVNIVSNADIDPSKVGDYSASDAEFFTATTPGDSASTSKPITMEGEIEKLRFAVERLALGVDVSRTADGATLTTANWIDLPARGPNLVRNGSFEAFTAGGANPPDGWTAVNGAPTAVSLQTTDPAVGSGKKLRFQTSAADQGFSQTFAGLKASTQYLVTCYAQVEAGGGNAYMTVTGADAASAFRSFTGATKLVTPSGTFTALRGVVKTDSTPTPLVVSILGDTNGHTVEFDDVSVRECNADYVDKGGSFTVKSEVTTVDTPSYGSGATGTDSGCSVAVTVPGPGYEIHVHGTVPMLATGGGVSAAFNLKESGTNVDYWVDNNNSYMTAKLSYVNPAPTPGTTYTYTMSGRKSANTLEGNPAALGTMGTPTTRIVVTLLRRA